MENSFPLNDYHIKKTHQTLNRLHMFIHGIALSSLFYYRFTSLNQLKMITAAHLIPNVLILISELIVTFIWVLNQASKWKPVTRTVYTDRLPENDKLPSIDVFICTADPNKEPSFEVMNTVISAMALDYPPDKISVYLSDDGGSNVTFSAIKEAWKFSRFWVPFCRKYEVQNRCPDAYFTSSEGGDDDDFVAEKKKIEKKYEEFKKSVAKIAEETSISVSKDHSPVIEVINDLSGNEDQKEMPLLVYVAREKRPSHPHHFKAGALNVLLRVSGLISNSPYILVLDCDMYCNDPQSAKQAMCFHLDTKLSPNLAFVQFPQKFYNISHTDIYDAQLRYVWTKFEGMDGLRGPILSGTGFYIRREALYGTRKLPKDVDVIHVRQYFGSSNTFIQSIYRNYKPNYPNTTKFSDNTLQKEFQFLASSSYDNGTKWGKEVGFRYFAVVEDYFTGFNLHCEGWISVYFEPSRPCFLGASPISLSELLVQHTRWNVGLMQVALSRFSPIIYGPKRMSILQSMCYAEFAYTPLYFVALYILALVPQLGLLLGIPLYPEVSSPFFFIFSFVFLSFQLKHVQEIFSTRHSIKKWSNEQRIWAMKSLTSYMYASLDAILEKIGMTKAIFLPTNKVVDNEQTKRYQMGVYDFQASPMFMVPLCSLYMLNVASFIIGLVNILQGQKGNEMIIQVFIAFFVTVVFFPLLEGMVLRKDKGSISIFVSLVSIVISLVVLSLVSLVNRYVNW